MLAEIKIFTILTLKFKILTSSQTIPSHSFPYFSHLIVEQLDVLEKYFMCCDSLFIYDITYFGKYTFTSLDILVSDLCHQKYKTPLTICL